MKNLIKKPFLLLIRFIAKIKIQNKFTETPVLLGGCGRSGTTVLLSILSAHPAIFAFPNELRLFENMRRNSNGKFIAPRMYRFYRSVLFHKVKKSADRWCEKSPVNVLRIREIDEYLKGKFKFIHIIRDGRDACLSVHPTDKTKYWTSPERWLRDVSAGLEFREDPRVLTIFYEDLILKYDETIETICDFLEIPLADELLNWHDNATVRKNKAYESKVQQLHPNSIGKWKNTKNNERVKVFMEADGVEKLMTELEYL